MRKNQNIHRITELNLFGLSDDENYFMSETWGLLTFYPTKSDSENETCRHCLLRPQCDVIDVHCMAWNRQDGRNGYFSIHQMPNPRK